MVSFREGIAAEGLAWFVFGLLGAVIFQGRFYLQWLASERAKKSIVPLEFWYMSSVGALMLLTYGVHKKEPVGVLSFAFNIVVYARNLVHIWRNRGRLTKTMHTAIHAGVALTALVAAYFVITVWMHQYEVTRAATRVEAQKTWFWIAVGTAGTAMFAGRFLIQWIATERARTSVIPNVFWYLSLGATFLQLASYTQRAQWVFALGSAASIVIYARNLWFIHRGAGESMKDER